jgi:predicted DNA-binding protein (MmcQ/YjbR family)
MKRSRLSQGEMNLRRLALSLPEAYEEFPWGHRALKVKGKAFAFMSHENGLLGLSVKLPHSGRIALIHPFAAPTGYGLGKSSWVTARFRENDEIPLELLKAWIEESYQAIAPKKILAKR